MKLIEILKNVDYELLNGSDDIEIKSIAYNSKTVVSNSLFVAIKGLVSDGHSYIKNAYESGANCIICENEPTEKFLDVTIIKVVNSREVLAKISSNFYNDPSAKFDLIGITGTNGKTTTTYLIKAILDSINKKVGLIGTIENRIGDKVIKTDKTTPESLELQKLFSDMIDENVTHAVMEVSSHSLDLSRVYGCDFDIAIFTNLSQDHLDYHETMENYKIAKSLLFKMSKKAVVNVDDDAGLFMKNAFNGDEILTYAIDNDADLKASNYFMDAKGVNFTLTYLNNSYEVSLNIPGKFSIYNALCAIGASLLMDISIDVIIDTLKKHEGVVGRFQTVSGKNGVNAIVDYAHTPDGLVNILQTAKQFVKGRIITVFGCGGDRDKTKRPLMGEIAGKYSDYAIITSDNPRTENPEQIVCDVEVGTLKTDCEYIKIVDRKEAIFHAVSISKKDDLIVIAGKGHETYQIFADKTIHFDDLEVINNAFSEV